MNEEEESEGNWED
jgi:pre-rRNA-processing protein TSR1